jgi:bifunctional non-homologous end joining protein LigD
MPAAIHPMLATPVEQPFDDPDWLFEIKLDGYRAIAFVQSKQTRLVSRNQNDLTTQFSELAVLGEQLPAKSAILDGEIVALDHQGRPSFSLMQQRTGVRSHGRRVGARPEIPILYYVFDLLYLDGFDLRRTPLGQRKALLASLAFPSNSPVRISEHVAGQGRALFKLALERVLEGIVAKRSSSRYEERRSLDWLKIKIRHQLECVVGGYTDPEGSRQYFGSIVLGLYDKQKRLIHVGQAGSGFDQRTLHAVWQRLKALRVDTSPFYAKVKALRRTQWVKPNLVAQVEYSEWTHSTDEGGPKLRAPVFLGLRDDKDPRECVLDQS